MTFAGDVIGNTTLVVVATDAALTKAQCTKLAAVAQNGLARALNPVHTMFDGDIVFGLSTGSAGVPGPGRFPPDHRGRGRCGDQGDRPGAAGRADVDDTGRQLAVMVGCGRRAAPADRLPTLGR